jgi:putative ABC transport system ATP-binding protein
MDVVVTSNLTKAYKQGDAEILAVNNANIRIQKGEFVSIIGKSGSGKTTLLNLIGGIDKPTSGTVEIDGVDIASVKDNQLAKIRRQKIGYVFQDFNLIPILTAEENIIMPALLDSRKADEAYLNELAGFLGLEYRLKHLPSELSGGQKQRVAIARALYNRPNLILADEPTGNLDKKSADEIIRLLFEVNKRGNTVLLVTHDQTYADMCQRKLMIEDGVIQ